MTLCPMWKGCKWQRLLCNPERHAPHTLPREPDATLERHAENMFDNRLQACFTCVEAGLKRGPTTTSVERATASGHLHHLSRRVRNPTLQKYQTC
jgi:hypothetical protein